MFEHVKLIPNAHDRHFGVRQIAQLPGCYGAFGVRASARWLAMPRCLRGSAAYSHKLPRKTRSRIAQKILVRSIPNGLLGLTHNVNLVGANRHKVPC